MSLELTPVDGGLLPTYTAGAHIDIQLPSGVIRQYSLCRMPGDLRSYQVAILKDPASRGGSAVLHDSVREGDRLMISAPRNLFPLAAQARHSILLAGGIGVTPVLAMAEQLSAEQRSFVLHYCARSADRMAFREHLQQATYAEQVYLHLDAGPPEQRLQLATVLASAEPDVHLYVCGPTGFIEYVVNFAQAHGWSPDQLHREYFSAEGNEAAPAEEFQVQIASTGEIFTVAEGESITDVLAEHGFDIPVSCGEGMCGSCLTDLVSVSGELQHNDMFLSESQQKEGRVFTPCCSRAKAGSLLILDL